MGIFFAVLIVSHLTDGRPQIEGDANTFVEGLLKQRFKGDTEIDDPTAAAALAYLKTVAGDDLCGKAAKVYVENIMRGEKKEVAMAEAGREYIDAFNAGARPASGSGCQAAEVAWKEAFVTGADPIPAAAKAYIRSWRSSKSKDPCTAASTKYFNEIQDGESHLDAAKYAMGAFVKALRKVNRDGRSYNDRACTNAAKAYAEALDEEQTPITAAFTAFLESMFDDNENPFDPVCYKVMQGFTNSFNSGDDAESQKKDSSTSSAMFAYISETLKSGKIQIDPVCAASTSAYMRAYKEKKDEEFASEAAAVAYLEALEKNSNFDPKSPCGKAAEAYIREFS